MRKIMFYEEYIVAASNRERRTSHLITRTAGIKKDAMGSRRLVTNAQT